MKYHDEGMKLMNINSVIYNRISFFGDYKHIEANSSNMITLMNLFQEENFLPGTVKEIQANIQHMQSPNFMGQAVDRMLLHSNNNEWSIIIGSQRIDIQQQPFNKNSSKEQAANRFITSAINYGSRIMNSYKLTANRLAINISRLCDDLDPETISKIGVSFSNPLAYYRNKKMEDWSIRFNTKGMFIVQN